MPSYDNTVRTPNSFKGVQRTWENSDRDALGNLILETNPLTERKFDVVWSSGTYRWDYTNAGCRTKWGSSKKTVSTLKDFDPQLYGTGAWPSSLESKAAWKFYQELTDVKLSVGQIIAERQQTVNMIANRVGSLYRAYRSLRKGKNPFANGRKVNPKDAPKWWLEYHYGWTPLVQDVYDAIELNSNSVPIVHLKRTVRGRRKFTTGGNTTGAFVTWTTENKFVQTHRCTIGAGIKMANPTFGFLSQFDISNPASLAWDLIPYSFVVDWFIPVGDWLRMQQARVGVQFEEPYTVHKTHLRVSSTVTGIGHPCRVQGFWVQKGPKFSEYDWKTRQRKLPGIPPLEADVNLNISKAISGLALLSGIFGRSRDSNRSVKYDDYVKLIS